MKKMPICSECSEEKTRDAFTKAQLRKPDATRRCKQCIETEGSQEASASSARQEKIARRRAEQQHKITRERMALEKNKHLHERASLYQPPPSPPPPIPLSGESRNQVLKLISKAVPRIVRRGVPPGVGLDGLTDKEIGLRLWQVSNNEDMEWLIGPLLVGLVNGGASMNAKTNMPFMQDPNPILMWLCQYRFYHAQFNYLGGDDMVALALAAGADVSMRASNGCNALFFAVKYTSAKTVEMLLDAGINVEDRDCYGQSIWKNATELPDLNIIKVLLDRCNSVLPVDTESITINMGRDNPCVMTLADNMLSVYIALISFTDNTTRIPISWQVVGAPKVDDLATALVRVLQAGARFSPTNLADPESLNYDPLAIVSHVDTPELDLTSMLTQPQMDTARVLRDVIYGHWLPDTIMKEVQSVQQSFSSDNTCPICLTDMEPSDKPVTLYCGHTYCLECIKAFGHANLDGDLRLRLETSTSVGNNGRVNLRTEGTDKRCPICRRLLCGDLLDLNNVKLRNIQAGMRLGIDRHETDGRLSGTTRRGPHLLTDEQLRFECSVVLGKSDGTRDSLQEELLQTMNNSSFTQVTGPFTDGDETVDIREENMKVELSASVTMAVGSENTTLIQAPRWGPVVVPIQVKGVPILASLSLLSIFTVVPRSVVKTFGLKTKRVSSSQFVSISPGKVRVAEVVEEFRFYLKDVEICLNNAVVLKNEGEGLRSVQLGMDFFESALWTRCSVMLGENYGVVTDGGYNKNNLSSNQPEELRYYSRDGKICQVPFIHVRELSQTKSIPIISLPGDHSAKCGECQWCCRYFPCDGMLKYDDESSQSSQDFRYYCDEECKAKGMLVRTDGA